MKPEGQDFLFPLFTGCLHGHTTSIRKSQITKSEFHPQKETQIPSGMIQMGVLVWHLHMPPEEGETAPSFRTP